MSVYGIYGEDIDFNMGLTSPQPNTNTSCYRTAYTRCGVQSNTNGGVCLTNQFAGGALTSFWLHAWFSYNSDGSQTNRHFGACLQSTGAKGLWVGTGSGTGNSEKLGLYKFDGTTLTLLAMSSVTIWTQNAIILLPFDIHVQNFGVSATVTVYVNNVSIITYAGDVTVSGVTNVDCVGVCRNGNVSGSHSGISEVMVRDTDTRTLQCINTLALTGAGTTNNWTNNTYTNVNGVTFSDANPTYVNTTGQNQQYNVTDPSPTVYTPAAVKISARLATGAGSTPTQVKLGYNSGGTVGFGTGAAKTPTSAYATYEQIDLVNPVTGVAFTPSEITALQLNLQSA